MPQSLVVYLTVSGFCLMLNNVVLILADLHGCTLLLSILFSYCVVVVAGYLLHSILTFRKPFGVTAFGRYAFSMAANIPLMFATTWFCRTIIGLPMPAAAPLATFCMVIINYALSHWAIAGTYRAARP